MKLKEFLELHDGGDAMECVTIKCESEYFCEEENQECILESDWFKEIAEREVRRFCVMIGESIHPVELYITIEEE